VSVYAPKIQLEKNPYVSVSWSWYNQNEGIVTWTFTNNSNEIQSVVLLRGAINQNGTVLAYYYFGNAYWVDYLSLGITRWQRDNTPLRQNENPPIAVLEVGQNYLIAFVFTLAPKETWSMLEGGFVDGLQPYNPVTITAKYLGDYNMCIGYDEKQVTDYVTQTGIPATGYEPNPSTFYTSVYEINGPYILLFKDYVKKGRCGIKECVQKIKRKK